MYEHSYQLWCPFADEASDYLCQRTGCAMAVSHTYEGETVWTCGLIPADAGNRIIIARGDGRHPTIDMDGGQQCRA